MQNSINPLKLKQFQLLDTGLNSYQLQQINKKNGKKGESNGYYEELGFSDKVKYENEKMKKGLSTNNIIPGNLQEKQ